jgi:NAD(P)-dependent dehydrogenase (short-subunit alcohol dehydrogenase family)
MELKDKVAVVTGAASGMGRASAIEMASRGAKLLVVDRDEDGAREVVDLIEQQGGAAVAVVADVSDDKTFETLLDIALTEHGGADLVMNNVGVITRGLPEQIPVDEWRRVLEINLFSLVRSNAVFIPHFLAQGSGHIVNTASFAGLFTYSYDRLPYAASKAAMVQISEGLRLYLEPQGIGVTLLCPGPVRTNIAANVRSFGPETVTRGPGSRYEYRTAEFVGALVADAVEQNRFMVATDDQVFDDLTARAKDWNGFIAAKVADVAGS